MVFHLWNLIHPKYLYNYHLQNLIHMKNQQKSLKNENEQQYDYIWAPTHEIKYTKMFEKLVMCQIRSLRKKFCPQD